LLHCASKKGHVEFARLLIEQLSDRLDIVDVNGNSALHLAAYGGHAEIVDYLLNRGCNSTLTNRWGLTAEEEGSKYGDRITSIFQCMRDLDMARKDFD
jgi:ankyrin repeat protein